MVRIAMDICYTVDRGLSKKDATKRARELRSEGYSVRVLRGKKGYSVIDCGNDNGSDGPSTVVLAVGGLAVAGAGYLLGKSGK